MRIKRGKKTSAEQVVLKLRQIEVPTAQGKSLASACKEAEISEQSYDRWRLEYGRTTRTARAGHSDVAELGVGLGFEVQNGGGRKNSRMDTGAISRHRPVAKPSPLLSGAFGHGAILVRQDAEDR